LKLCAGTVQAASRVMQSARLKKKLGLGSLKIRWVITNRHKQSING